MFIVPKPQSITIGESPKKLGGLTLLVDDERILRFAGSLEQEGTTVVRFAQQAFHQPEKYTLTVDDSGIQIAYNDLEAAFRAYTTLKQILACEEDGHIPLLQIEDFPGTKNRGYMLDISRGKIPKLEYLKKLCDLLADLKYNQLQLYMENLVFEYEGFEKHWQDKEALKREEIQELDRYCKERFIDLVPNQNSFGHMMAWTRLPELSHLAISNADGSPSHALNPLDDGSIDLVDRIYTSLLKAFSSEYLHVGCDEVGNLGQGQTKEACEQHGVGKVYTDYLKKVCTLASEKHGKTPMFWDDIVVVYPDWWDNIPENAVFMQWGYESWHQFDKNCQRLKEKGRRFYVCPGTSMWGSLGCGRSDNAIDNILVAARCANEYGAEGFLLTEWGDGGHPQFPAAAYLPLAFGGSVSWNHKRNRILALSECKQYLDKYVYHSVGANSLAEIVYRLGNYYHLEDIYRPNATRMQVFTAYKTRLNREQRKAAERVSRYLQDVRKDFEEVIADEAMQRQVKLTLDLAICIAEYLCQRNLADEFEACFAEYESLWRQDNRVTGMEIYLSRIKAFASCELCEGEIPSWPSWYNHSWPILGADNGQTDPQYGVPG